MGSGNNRALGSASVTTPEARADAWVWRCPECGQQIESTSAYAPRCRGNVIDGIHDDVRLCVRTPVYFESSVRELVEALKLIRSHFEPYDHDPVAELAREALAKFEKR
jgi:hypothetical protein